MPQQECSPNLTLLVSLVVLLTIICFVVLTTYLVMIIWNKVLVVKLKGSKIQKIDFWESLAIAVFVNIVIVANLPHTVIVPWNLFLYKYYI